MGLALGHQLTRMRDLQKVPSYRSSLRSDMTMSTDIQVAFSFVSALDICLTSFGGARIVGARNADHVDYGPLNPASLPLGLTLCHQDLPGELTDYQELTEFKGRATRSFVLGTRQMSITNRVSARIPKGNLVSMGPKRGGFRRGTKQSSRVKGQNPLPEQEEFPIPAPSFVGGPSGAAPAMPTMPGDPNFQQTLELLTQALSRTGQSRDPSLGYADRAKRIGATYFDGDGDPAVVEEWIERMERIMKVMAVPQNRRYYPQAYQNLKMKEFLQLEQRTMTVLEYDKKFNELSKYCVPLVEDENKKCQLFTRGLKASIRDIVISQRLANFGVLVMSASLIESSQMIVRARGEPRRRQFDMGGPSQGSSKKGSYSSGSSSGRSYGGFRRGVSSSGGSNQSGSSGSRGSTARGSVRQLQSASGKRRNPQSAECGSFSALLEGRRSPNHNSHISDIKDEPRPDTKDSSPKEINRARGESCQRGGEAIVASPQGIGTQGRSQGTSQFVGASSSGGAQTSVASRGGSQHKGRGGRFRATGRVYNMSQQEAQASLDVIIGILPVFGIPARVLIDPGATHSFVTPSFAHNANVRLSALRNELAISVTTGEIFQVGTVYRDSIVLVGDVFLEADLIPLGLVDLDVILNMDWLAKHHASVDCFRKESASILPHFSYDGKTVAQKREFPDVFPEDLPGLPPHREIEFIIELVPGTNPISQAPYRMALAELKELKI
ncbi:hypothetical protein Prudu_333S000100 [Prunus dulcis]|uniref:Retrotransposon gag domain-containing protein n=1 Tax=Prunus dulcis TaxID=3755 RepID=A0A5H2Y590_PRUDU|nr:hypothetical protein Prudu_333S000100 [Prunus dulcis]